MHNNLTSSLTRKTFNLFVIAALLMVALGLSPVPLAQAATITVTNTNDSGPGSLRQALADAGAGDTINFAVTGTITLTSGQLTVAIPGQLTITGPGVDQLTISGNNASRVFFIDDGTVAISGLTIADGNTASHGGGIYNQDGDLTLTNCTVSGNTAGNRGGGIFNDEYARLTLTNCTVSGNTAGDRGGGIYNVESADLTLTNCTVSGNTSGGSGGGIYDDGSADFKNTIIANNTATNDGPDCDGSLYSYGYNLVEDTTGCTVFGDTTGNIIGQDPNLGPLQDNGGPTETHALPPGSPALDAASCKDKDNNDVTQDQRGVTRPQPTGGSCDIGAFELEAGTIIVEKQTDPDGAAGSFTFNGGAIGPISDGQQTADSVLPGSYAVVEDAPTPAFALTDITCDDGDSAAPSTWDVGTRTATVNLEEKETVICTFTNTRQYLLTVEKVAGEAEVSAQAAGWSGTVTSDPAGIDCGADCTKHYFKDTVVTLTAHPGLKSYFVGWSGDCDANGQVTMNADKTCTATFGYPVGGIVVPVDKLELVAPWMGLVALAVVVGVLLWAQRRK